MIRKATASDSDIIADIYNYYIEHSIATFEQEAVAPAEMADRIQKVFDAGLPWLVAESNGSITGYAYASPWKSRAAYRFSVESTVYLCHTHSGQGLGSKLYEALFNELKPLDVRTVIGGIALPNPSSIALHEKFGMKQVAHFKAVGFKFNQWIDVGYWQVVLP
ncbi:MAG: N-acetyltransferase [Desulfobacteraceae bacterium]|nr:MAG: N-acetyltransferase [Desulfobacteraceae bacterium]